MAHLLAGGWRIRLLMGAALLVVFLATACDRLQLRPRETGEPPTSTSEPTAQPSPTPDVPTPDVEEAKPVDVGAVLGATLIEGRPYLRDTLAGAVLYHEPWVDYQAVQQLKQAYTLTQDLLQQELGIADLAQVTIYLVLKDQFNRFAEDHNFQHPSYLAGFYSYFVREGQVVDAEIFLNAGAQGIVHNVAHEMAHLATPGLPTWIGEGVADYIGARAGTALEPQAAEQRMRKARQTVRAALRRDMLLDWDELEEFNWTTTDDLESLDMVYAESWQLVEYVARQYAPDGLRNLVAGHGQDAQEDDDPFPLAVGVSAETLWQGFSTDIVENLTLEERVGLNLCDLIQVGREGEAITREWNRVLARVNREEPGLSTEQFRRFESQWNALASEAAELEAPGEASAVRELWLDYFETMAQAMGDFAIEGIVNANRQLIDANQQYSRATAALQEALLQRRWLACE